MKKRYIIIAAAVILGAVGVFLYGKNQQSAKIIVATDTRCLPRRTDDKVRAFLNTVHRLFGRVHGNDVKGSGDLSHPLDRTEKKSLAVF